MKIFQILNNNVVTSIENGKEVIIFGTGIGFRKSKGDLIDVSKIQNKFYPANYTLTQQLITLMEEVSEEIINLVSEIVLEAETKLNIQLNSGIYITLIDHIAFSIERYEKGIILDNILLWDIKRLYKKEFEIGLWAIDIINKKLNVKFNENEAAFIANHIVNADLNVTNDHMNQMTHIINEILKIIGYHFQVDFDEDSLEYLRLINHLKFFAQRIISDIPYDSDYGVLTNAVKKNYPSAYLCAEKITKYIKAQYNWHVSQDEMTYLTIHIQRLIDTK